MKIKITVTTGSTAVVSAITFDPVPPTSTAPASRVFAQTGSLGRLLGSMPDGTPINLQYHTDAHGNVTALSDAYGNLSTAYYTDAWGNVIAGSSSQNPYVNLGNHGYWQDADLGLNYVRARWLNSKTGTWLSRDPISGQPGYSYVGNKPTTHSDPSGRNAIGDALDSFENWLAQTKPMQALGSVSVNAGLLDQFDAFTGGLIDEPEPLYHKFVDWSARHGSDLIQHLHMPGDIKGAVNLLRQTLPAGLANRRESQAAADLIEFEGGLIYGLYSGIAHFFVDLPSSVLRLISSLFHIPTALTNLSNGVMAFFHSFVTGDMLEGLKRLKFYDLGKIVGEIVVAVVAIILFAPAAAKSIASGFRSILAAVKSLPQAIRTAKATLGIYLVTRNLDAAAIVGRVRELIPKPRMEWPLKEPWERHPDLGRIKVLGRFDYTNAAEGKLDLKEVVPNFAGERYRVIQTLDKGMLFRNGDVRNPYRLRGGYLSSRPKPGALITHIDNAMPMGEWPKYDAFHNRAVGLPQIVLNGTVWLRTDPGLVLAEGPVAYQSPLAVGGFGSEQTQLVPLEGARFNPLLHEFAVDPWGNNATLKDWPELRRLYHETEHWTLALKRQNELLGRQPRSTGGPTWKIPMK